MKHFSFISIFFLITGITISSFAFDGNNTFVLDKAYFDIATNHIYIKNSETTYKEYCKKGRLLRESVPENLPLLTSGKYVHEIDENDYLLYEKWDNCVLKRKIQPATSLHPRGWRCAGVYVPLKKEVSLNK